MINFDEEVKKYTAMKDVDQIADVIAREQVPDMTEILQRVIAEMAAKAPAEDAQGSK